MELEPAGREDGLVAQSQLERMLAVTESPGELKGLLDKAAAFQELTSRMRVALEEHNRIAEFRIRVARKLGMVLSQTVQRGGSGRKAPGAAQGRGGCSAPLPDGITPAQSSRLQKLARIPDEQFQGYVARCHEHGRALTMAGLLRASAPPRPSSRNGQRRRARSAEPHHPAIRDAALRCLGPDAAVMRCPGPPSEVDVLTHASLYVETSEESAALWIGALNARSADGTLAGAIVAISAEPCAPWWGDLDAEGWLFCMPRPREAANRCAPADPPTWAMVAYRGRHRHGFALAFRELGPVMVVYSA